MDQRRLPLTDAMRADDPHREDDGTHEVRPDVAYQRIVFVNLVYLGPENAGDRGWVLVDTGVTRLSEGKIEHTAAARFGAGARPAAIVLTHGHFDHVGAAQELAERWDCPVYAHPLELPYLDGRSAYPPPDPSVGGGMVALSSPAYPRGPIDLGARLRPLTEDGSVPGMPGWRWIHAPGHCVGQVALWRESDRMAARSSEASSGSWPTTSTRSTCPRATSTLSTPRGRRTARRTFHSPMWSALID